MANLVPGAACLREAMRTLPYRVWSPVAMHLSIEGINRWLIALYVLCSHCKVYVEAIDSTKAAVATFPEQETSRLQVHLEIIGTGFDWYGLHFRQPSANYEISLVVDQLCTCLLSMPGLILC